MGWECFRPHALSPPQCGPPPQAARTRAGTRSVPDIRGRSRRSARRAPLVWWLCPSGDLFVIRPILTARAGGWTHLEVPVVSVPVVLLAAGPSPSPSDAQGRSARRTSRGPAWPVRPRARRDDAGGGAPPVGTESSARMRPDGLSTEVIHRSPSRPEDKSTSKGGNGRFRRHIPFMPQGGNQPPRGHPSSIRFLWFIFWGDLFPSKEDVGRV